MLIKYAMHPPYLWPFAARQGHVTSSDQWAVSKMTTVQGSGNEE